MVTTPGRCVLALVVSLNAGPAAAATQQSSLESLYAAARNDPPRSFALLQAFLKAAPSRFAGTSGELAAANWAESRLREIGFDTVWTETFPIKRWEAIAELATILTPTPRALSIAALRGSESTTAEGITAQVTSISSFAAADTLKPGSLSGRIVFVDRPMARAMDGTNFVAVNAPRTQVVAKLARAGAVAVLFRAHGTSRDQIHYGGIGYPDTALRIPAATISNRDADVLRNALRTHAGVRVSLIIRAAEYAATSQNVIAELRGATPELVIAGAHLDAYTAGATDDAAGVVTILEAARLLAANKTQMRHARTLRVILFGGEEIGLAGANVHARALDKPVRIAVESDQGAGAIYRLRFEGTDSAAVMLRRKWSVFLEPLAIDVTADRSVAGPDLIPFRARNVQTFDLAQDMTSFFDYMHTAADTIDKVDARVLASNIGIYAGVLYIALQP